MEEVGSVLDRITQIEVTEETQGTMATTPIVVQVKGDTELAAAASGRARRPAASWATCLETLGTNQFHEFFMS